MPSKYNFTDISASEVLDSHTSVLTSFEIDTNHDELDLLDSKDAQNPYKHRFIAGSAKCSIKPLSILHTKLFTQGLQKFCETVYSRSWSESDVDPHEF